MKISIHSKPELQELLSEIGEKSFRYKQISQAIYKETHLDFESMTTLSKDLREKLAERVEIQTLKVDHEATCEKGQTTKFLFETHDNMHIEAVLMRHKLGRNTLCISSQVGCPMACVFCATGKLGLKRNLTVHEMIEQILVARNRLAQEGMKLRNIVFMGMGEPLLNYDAVAKAMRIMTDEEKLAMSPKRITISTCGIVPAIDKLTKDFPTIGLAISLHAPNDEGRSKIMPVNLRYPVEQLMESIDNHVAKTGKRILYEYIMIAGYTDSLQYAHELGKLLKERNGHVNCIPYNPGEGAGGIELEKSSPYIIKKFQQILEKYGVSSTTRFTMGDDIDAACGQLALKKKDEESTTVA